MSVRIQPFERRQNPWEPDASFDVPGDDPDRGADREHHEHAGDGQGKQRRQPGRDHPVIRRTEGEHPERRRPQRRTERRPGGLALVTPAGDRERLQSNPPGSVERDHGVVVVRTVDDTLLQCTSKKNTAIQQTSLLRLQ